MTFIFNYVKTVVIFDKHVVTAFRKIIMDELAYNIFLDPEPVRKEVDGNHIMVRLFQHPRSMQETMFKLMEHYISNSKVKSIIGFSENDQALIAIATQVAYRMELPFYAYDMENDRSGAFDQFVEPAKVPCCLVIPYSVTAQHVQEIVDIFSQQKVPIKQIISMVEEKPLNFDFGNGIGYTAIASWKSIRERIRKFRNLTDEKMNEMLSFLP